MEFLLNEMNTNEVHVSVEALSICKGGAGSRYLLSFCHPREAVQCCVGGKSNKAVTLLMQRSPPHHECWIRLTQSSVGKSGCGISDVTGSFQGSGVTERSGLVLLFLCRLLLCIIYSFISCFYTNKRKERC